MPYGARELIEETKKRSHFPNLVGVVGSVLFIIDGAGTWLLVADDGKATITEGKAEADATVELSEEDFLRIMRGEQNMLTAVLQGRIGVAGDLALLLRFHGVLPGPQDTKRADKSPRKKVA